MNLLYLLISFLDSKKKFNPTKYLISSICKRSTYRPGCMFAYFVVNFVLGRDNPIKKPPLGGFTLIWLLLEQTIKDQRYPYHESNNTQPQEYVRQRLNVHYF